MPATHNFEHLALLLRQQGRAKLYGGGKPTPQTVANKNARAAHSASLSGSAQSISKNFQDRQSGREAQNLPALPSGVPILLQVDPGLDLDSLREKYAFEIVAEQEDGYVIVAAEDIDLTAFLAMVDGFSVQVHGSAMVAQVHKLFDDPSQVDRLRQILSDRLFEHWPQVADDQTYIVDIGIACSGTQEIPARPNRGKRQSDADWARSEQEWSQARLSAYDQWDEVKRTREKEIEDFAANYGAEILHLIDNSPFDAGVLPDSFTVRLRISGRGLRDLILNYAYIFEVVEPEDIALPQQPLGESEPAGQAFSPTPPEADAPAVCVIDSGVQEGHLFIQPAIATNESYCFLPAYNSTYVGDYVAPGGHGTRVAGAVLFGDVIPSEGNPQLPFWIQNARILDDHNSMPVELFPPQILRAVVRRFHEGPRKTRVFNHSINATASCRTRYMSSWAAEIDLLSQQYDILIVQSAGNIPISGPPSQPGIQDHLAANRDFPAFLLEPSARIANPGQSLQALTVGSVAYGALEAGSWKTFADVQGAPSAFSRTGPSIWKVTKPEVVEFGGDSVRSESGDVQGGGKISGACPSLVRSTMFPPGPAADRDAAGTSFAAPKVSRIAAQLQRVLPNQPSLLYRGLIVQSARWPQWAETLLIELRSPTREDPARKQELLEQLARVIRHIGYGVPDEAIATKNTDYRTTFITDGAIEIRATECHIYQVPIPPELRGSADEYDIRVDVTLSYVAQPRRTRRNLRRYLSTWVDWKSSKLGEGIHDFSARALKDSSSEGEGLIGSVLPWTLQDKADAGFVRDVRRNSGTVQKDWAVVKSNMLPDHFCIAVVGHQGWSRDPDSAARYTLAVSLEVIGKEIAIYEPLRAAVQELKAQTQVEVEVEVEAES
jgi:hypothetical protein